MKKYIFSLVCLCCTLLPALEGQAHEYPNHPELRKSDANIVGHILDKNTKEHLPYITVALKGTTIGTVTDASVLKVTHIDNGYTELTWQAATDNDQRNKPMYVIYASNDYPVDINRPENIVAQNIRETSYVYAPILPWNAKKHFAVTAIDRYGNESTATQEQTVQQ